MVWRSREPCCVSAAVLGASWVLSTWVKRLRILDALRKVQAWPHCLPFRMLAEGWE